MKEFERLEQYTDVLGSELGAVHHHIWEKFLRLTRIWDFACSISLTEDRWTTLQAGLNGFGVEIYQQLVDSSIAALMRLLDPATTGHGARKQDNLSLRRLVELCPIGIRQNIDKEMAAIEQAATDLKLIRHKLLSHNDLEYSVEINPSLTYPSRLEVTNIFKKILELLNMVDAHFKLGTNSILPMGNDPALLMLNCFRAVEIMFDKELEAARTGSLNIDIGRSEFLNLMGHFKETQYEVERYR